MQSIGLYIHVPFCQGKCPYCDFYSLPSDDETRRQYTRRVCEELRRWGAKLMRPADTLYFGGGTPSLLGGENIRQIVTTAKSVFGLENAEITLECNPSNPLQALLPAVADAGVNRISFGLQSAVDEERRALGRKATVEDALRGIRQARQAGITDISLDLMLGVPGQTADSLKTSLEFCASSGVEHISAYLLKIEEATPFYRRQSQLNLPDEDTVCDFYLEACRILEQFGFPQYEISNFARPGHESRHNLKYWNAEEYLGVGPSAHSFLANRRFYYPRDLHGFLDGSLCPTPDGAGGSFEEYAMLRLRLAKGLENRLVQKRFGHAIPAEFYDRCAPFAKMGLLHADDMGIRFTKEGFLLSNTLIGAILIDDLGEKTQER